MNQTEQILLQAIQKSLWNKEITFPDDTDWDAVLKEATVQTVLGVAIGAAPSDVQQKWKGMISAGTAHFVRILHYQEQLYNLLKEYGIPMVILKGTAAAIYYPNPSLRVMGDIDFLVPLEQFDHAKEILTQNGYTIKDDPRYSRHIDVRKDQVSFEMHRYFSECNVDIEQYILEQFDDAKCGIIFGKSFPMLPRLANGLVLLAHISYHLQTGLGLRQVIDWMTYVNRELDDAFWHQGFHEAAKESGMEILAITITRLCQIYLGLSDEITWCKDASADLCSELMESILLAGNFGRKQGHGRSISNTVTNLKEMGFFRYLQIAGEFNWKAYHKHKWLKPFCWIYQIGRYTRQGLETNRSRKQVLDDVGRGNQRAELLEKLGLKRE